MLRVKHPEVARLERAESDLAGMHDRARAAETAAHLAMAQGASWESLGGPDKAQWADCTGDALQIIRDDLAKARAQEVDCG